MFATKRESVYVARSFIIRHYWTKWYGTIPSCVYVHPQVNLQCDNCLRCVQGPRELLAHVETHGHPIGHLLSSYRSRSPRESAAELASVDSYVPESRIPSRSTSVFDDASYASSRVIAAEIHSPPRSISSQMPTASAQPLAQSTQIPYTISVQSCHCTASTVLAFSATSTPSHGSEVTLLREQ